LASARSVLRTFGRPAISVRISVGDWVEPALVDDVVLGGLRFTVVHETGAATGRNERMARTYPGTDVQLHRVRRRA
jgi:hypothetical protein